MKALLAGSLCLSLFFSATTALADPTSAELEKQALASMDKASQDMDVAVAAFKKNDPQAGCTALHLSYDDVVAAIDLLNKDADVVRADPALSETDRTARLNDISAARGNFTKNRIDILQTLHDHCV